MKLAVHFGAGNIGRGFVAPTLQANHYKVIFVDINTDLVDQLKKEGHYTISSLNIDGVVETTVQNVEAVSLSDIDKVNEILLRADLITTSVGPKYVEGIFEMVAKLEHSKSQIFVAFENMYRASSSASSTIKPLNQNLKIIDAVVDKIVPPQPMTSLDVTVETYGSIILDESTHLQPLDTSEIVTYGNYENEFYKKLWLLNGLHLQLAYYGLSNGFTYIDEVISNTKGRAFAEKAIKSLSEAYSLFSKTNEDLSSFSQTIIYRFALPQIKDEVSRIARNPEIKFSKNERFEYPLRLLIANNKDVETFSKVLDMIISEEYPQVEGFNNFKETVLIKGKSNIYSKFWKIQNHGENYIERLGS